MAYQVIIRPSAAKAIRKLSKKAQRRVLASIEDLADDPRSHGCEKLAGSDYYRIRSGDYRIIYEIMAKELVVHVVRVGDRKEVYKHL